MPFPLLLSSFLWRRSSGLRSCRTINLSALLPCRSSASETFVEVLNAPSFRGSILNTLVLGASAATLVTVLSIIVGWCVARHVAGSHLLDALAALPLVFPAIVLGLAFLEIFVNIGGSVYGSLSSLVASPLLPICRMACGTPSSALFKFIPSSKRRPRSPARGTAKCWCGWCCRS